MIVPEQIILRGTKPTSSALVDAWGRVHSLDPRTSVGRDGADGLFLFEPHVSRRHAVIARKGSRWWLTDLHSSNGTFLDGERISKRTELQHAARITFGVLNMFYVAHADVVGAPRSTRRNTTNALPRATTARNRLRTRELELPQIKMRYHEPTGGGGGLVQLLGKTVQLTPPQLELVVILAQRMAADTATPADERGFVAAAHLLEVVSLDATGPNPDNIRQLVRRVRRVFHAAGLPDLIESRRGRGYRFRTPPFRSR